MKQGDRDIDCDWHKAYVKLKMRLDETSKMLKEQSELNKKLSELLDLFGIIQITQD